MLRWIVSTAIITVIAAIVITWQAKRCETAREKCQAATATHPLTNPMLRVLIRPDSNGDQEQAQDQAGGACAHANAYLCRVLTTTNLPTIYLVLIGIGGIAVAVGTLQILSRQADTMEEQVRMARDNAHAARDNAKAARLNAQAVINAERAWVVVNVALQAPNEFIFSAKNVGKTPAKIIGIYSSKTSLNRGEKFEPSPEYEKGESLLSSPPCLLPPTVEIPIYHYKLAELRGNRSVEEWLSYFIRGFANVYVYGKITYYDVFEASPKEPHVTKWLYWHMPIEGSVLIPSPKHPEYNDYT